MPKALAAALSYDAGMEERREFGVEDELGSDEDEAERMCTGCGVVDDEPCRQDCPTQTLPAAIATFEATGEQRVRLVVDGVTMWASTITIERFEIPPAVCKTCDGDGVVPPGRACSDCHPKRTP